MSDTAFINMQSAPINSRELEFLDLVLQRKSCPVIFYSKDIRCILNLLRVNSTGLTRTELDCVCMSNAPVQDLDESDSTTNNTIIACNSRGEFCPEFILENKDNITVMNFASNVIEIPDIVDHSTRGLISHMLGPNDTDIAVFAFVSYFSGTMTDFGSSQYLVFSPDIIDNNNDVSFTYETDLTNLINEMGAQSLFVKNLIKLPRIGSTVGEVSDINQTVSVKKCGQNIEFAALTYCFLKSK
ncbi:hypothetical protein nvc2_066 [Namao virus]|nr:hypothetical protein nvc2_066 [Namao virus]